MHPRMKITIATLILGLSAVPLSVGALVVSSPTTGWTPLNYAVPERSDPSRDLQTSSVEGDVVGDATHPSLYLAFENGGTKDVKTDGEIGFRLRVAGDANPDGFKSVFWVGIDANRDGKIDVFAGAIESTLVGIYQAGSGKNTSPSSTSIDVKNPLYQEKVVAGSNHDWQAVSKVSDPTATNYNLDGGSKGSEVHTDHFVSFKLPFDKLVAAISGLSLPGLATFNEDTPMRFVAATSTQRNSLNQDLNGVDRQYQLRRGLGGTRRDHQHLYVHRHAFHRPAIPEPTQAMLLLLATLFLGCRRPHRRHPTR